jgi:hypothetical protein
MVYKAPAEDHPQRVLERAVLGLGLAEDVLEREAVAGGADRASDLFRAGRIGARAPQPVLDPAGQLVEPPA